MIALTGPLLESFVTMERIWCGASCEMLEYDPGELIELVKASDPLVDALVRDGIRYAGADLGAVLQGVTR